MKNIRKTYSLGEFGVTLHKSTLENGLRIAFIEKPFAPIYAQITVKGGSSVNPCDNGLAHFAEHIIVSSSKKYPKKEDLAKIINEIGGFSNAYTSPDKITFECEVAVPEHLAQMKMHFTEVLTDLHLTPELIEREQKVISAELQKKMSGQWYGMGQFILGTFAKDSPWGYLGLGTIDSIKTITHEMLEEFFLKYFVVENMSLVVCGGCTFDEIRKTFENIPFRQGGHQVVPAPDPDYLPPGQRLFYWKDVNESTVDVTFNGPKLGTRDSAILNFSFDYSHRGLDSLFYRKIRNEQGFAYQVSKFQNNFGDTRYIGTSIGVDPQNIDPVIDTVLECYRELSAEGMTTEKIKSRIDRLYFSGRRNFERSIDWVREFEDTFEDYFLGDWPDILNFCEQLTPEDVIETLRRYVKMDDFHLIITGRECSKKFW